jgi:peptidoglycan/xylan/chitin deacetylase (PgdA/CDA1 family)
VNSRQNAFLKGIDIGVSATIFRKHLRYLLNNYKIISLKKLIKCLKKDKIPPHSIIITFDDGFADNFTFAYPLLKKYNISATIFLTTDCIENQKPIWIQELNYLFNKLDETKVIEEISNLVGREKFRQILEKSGNFNNNKKRIIDLFAYSIGKKSRDRIIEGLYFTFRLKKKKIFAKNQVFLNWKQIREMQQNGMSFGNHGASHTPFSVMAIEEQKEEIENSKEIIANKLKQNFLPFAYPFGTDKDFTEDTKALVKKAGHNCILTTMHTNIYSGTSPFELGRIDMSSVPVYYLAFELEKNVLKRLLYRK